MTNEYTVYSKWLALALREQGFKLNRTGINKNFPQYITYIFADSPELQNAIKTLSEQRKSK